MKQIFDKIIFGLGLIAATGISLALLTLVLNTLSQGGH